MARRPAHHPPKQARSRETLRRMLDAAEIVLARYGFDGATLPRIAKEAGCAPSSVYRRFRDKDALMRAVFSRFSDHSAAALAQPFDLEAIRPIGLRTFTRQWVEALIRSYRARTGIMRASILYSRQHADAVFIRRQRRLEARHFQRAVDTFLLWRHDIRHPNPEEAVRFAMVMIGSVLQELILFDHAAMMKELVSVNDDHLKGELPRLFLRYLGVRGE